jgi:hypothetical protein
MLWDCYSFVLSEIQGDCKVTVREWLEQRQIQNEDNDAKLFLFLVNLCQCFSAQAT